MDRLNELSILFIEENKEFAKNTIAFLDIYFKNIHHTDSIKTALAILGEYKIDIIITDIKLPDGNGLDFIQKLREEQNNVQSIILSAYKNEKLLLQAIPLHLISYEIKPISYDNLQKLLKKISIIFKPQEISNITKKLKYNSKSKELIYEKKNISLTKKEILFIEYMIKNSPKILSYEMIQIYIWENKFMSNASIKNLILRLRKKVDEEFIVSVTGVGYKFL